MRTKIL